MGSAFVRLFLLLGTLLIAGCITPQNTRLPSLAYSDAETQRAEYSRHDPLPEVEIGPPTTSRPRGFEQDRAEPRRVVEHSLGIRTRRQMQQGTPPPAIPPAASRYPQTVTP